MSVQRRVVAPLAVLFLIITPPGLLAEPMAGQSQLQFEQLGYRDGLMNSSVSSIVQDQAGFLWFGTQGGLQRYDGYQMRLFGSVPFDRDSLSHQLVQTLYRDRDDTLWIGTYGGLNRLDSVTERITHYRHEADNPASLSDGVVVAIARDAAETLWVGTLNGLNRLDTGEDGDGDTFTRFAPDPDDPHSLPDNVIRALFSDSRGQLWVGSYGGLSRVEQTGDGSVRFHGVGTAGRDNELPSRFVMDIDEDDEGNLWIGTWDGGVSRLAPDGSLTAHFNLPDNRVYQILAARSGLVYAASWGGGLAVIEPDSAELQIHIHNASDPFSIGHDVVYSLFEDRSGIIWIGTNGNGISKLNPRQVDYRFIYPELPPEQRVSSGRVQEIHHDPLTDLLLIGGQGSGLNVRDPATGVVTTYRHRSGDPASLGNDNVNTLLRDHPDYLLVGTHAGIDRFYPDQGRFETDRSWFAAGVAEPPIVYALMRDGGGSLWVGTYDRGVLRLMPDGSVRNYRNEPQVPRSLSNNLVYDIVQDSRGDIWIATNGGLNRYLPQHDGFRTYLYDPEDTTGISSSSTVRILEDSEGSIWVASRSGGIMRYNACSDTFSHVTTAHGLSSNSVAAFLEGEPGVFYVATPNGMNRVETDPLRVGRIDERDGLRTREFSSGAAGTPCGDLLFGAFSEIARITPGPLRESGTAPQIQLTDIMVMNRPYPRETATHHLTELNLPHTENFVRFEFAALEFSTPSRNSYRYRLVGVDPDWVDAGTQRTADYTGLPPGRFTFEVMAADSRGSWSPEPTRITLTIEPPYWRTAWFSSALILLLALLAWLISGLRNRTLKLRTARLESLVDSRTAELSRANEELTQANAGKDRFFSIIAHDLRGPISGMSNFMGRVVHEFADYDRETLKEISSVILDSVRGLEAMLENLLEWSQLQSGRIEVDPQIVPLRDLLDSIFEAYHGAAGAKSIQLRQRCPAEARVWADIHRTKTIVQNLVSNAIKFTPAGGAVTASAETVEMRTRIIVEDTGVGIPADRLDALFREERAVRTVGTAGEKGSGLGLILCRELAGLLGGSLSIESIEGQGSRVIVELPYAPER